MKKLQNVKGTMETVKEVEFNFDIVYYRTNIVSLENAWQYDETQYTYQEWAELSENKISILEEENEALKVELSITQDAVNELLFNTLNA